MRVAGLTGGIAAGKSTATRLLRERGIPVIDCDAIAHHYTKIGGWGYRRVVAAFGPDVLLPSGRALCAWTPIPTHAILGTSAIARPDTTLWLTLAFSCTSQRLAARARPPSPGSSRRTRAPLMRQGPADATGPRTQCGTASARTHTHVPCSHLYLLCAQASWTGLSLGVSSSLTRPCARSSTRRHTCQWPLKFSNR